MRTLDYGQSPPIIKSSVIDMSQTTTVTMASSQELHDCHSCGANATIEVPGGQREEDVYYYCEGCAPPRGCSECGAVATTELEDEHGEMWPLCANCDVWWRETQAELADQAEALNGQRCQDCRLQPATCRFVHLRKGEFFLCDNCFGWADHEDDYLENCQCEWPEGDPGQTDCDLCRRPLPTVAFYCACAAPVVKDEQRVNCRSCNGRIRFRAPKPLPLCECPLPCTVDGDETYCFLCSGRIVHLTDDDVDAMRRRASS